eukprot:gene5000-34784_t
MAAAAGGKRAAESAPDVDMADASEGVQNKMAKIQHKAPTKAAAIKIILTDSGFETDVFEYTMRKPAPKKSDRVKLVKEKCA